MRISFFVAPFGVLFGALAGTILSSPPVFAATTSNNQQPVYQIQQMDPKVPVEKLAGPGIKIHKASELKKKGWALPTVQDRETAFSQAGLKELIASWDQLDRDMLYLRARDQDTPTLIAQYPKLPSGKLQALHDYLKSVKKKGKHS